jgi:hypothetical protein
MLPDLAADAAALARGLSDPALCDALPAAGGVSVTAREAGAAGDPDAAGPLLARGTALPRAVTPTASIAAASMIELLPTTTFTNCLRAQADGLQQSRPQRSRRQFERLQPYSGTFGMEWRYFSSIIWDTRLRPLDLAARLDFTRQENLVKSFRKWSAVDLTY